MAARSLLMDTLEQVDGSDEALPYTPSRRQEPIQFDAPAYRPSRALSPVDAPANAVARRASFESVDDFFIDEFAQPLRCQARRSADQEVAARGAIMVAAIAGAATANAQALLKQEDLEQDEPTAHLPIVTSAAPQIPSAFVTRRIRGRKGALTAIGLAAAVAFTGVGLGAQAFSTAPQSSSIPVSESLTQDHAAADESLSRSAVRSEVVSEFAASEPVIALTPRPSIEGIIAPGQLAPNTTDEALAKARSMVGNQSYGNMCLALVSSFYGYSSAGIDSAQAASAVIEKAGMMHTDMTDIPVGALIWYDGLPSGNPYGHVAMYAGDGMIYSNGASTGVGKLSIDTPAKAWHEPIIGWSPVWLPNATK